MALLFALVAAVAGHWERCAAALLFCIGWVAAAPVRRSEGSG